MNASKFERIENARKTRILKEGVKRVEVKAKKEAQKRGYAVFRTNETTGEKTQVSGTFETEAEADSEAVRFAYESNDEEIDSGFEYVTVYIRGAK